jgi:hypothetical protein
MLFGSRDTRIMMYTFFLLLLCSTRFTFHPTNMTMIFRSTSMTLFFLTLKTVFVVGFWTLICHYPLAIGPHEARFLSTRRLIYHAKSEFKPRVCSWLKIERHMGGRTHVHRSQSHFINSNTSDILTRTAISSKWSVWNGGKPLWGSSWEIVMLELCMWKKSFYAVKSLHLKVSMSAFEIYYRAEKTFQHKPESYKDFSLKVTSLNDPFLFHLNDAKTLFFLSR